MSTAPQPPNRKSSSAFRPVNPAVVPWPALEAILHRDVGERGLAAYRSAGDLLDAGQLRAAATHLAQHAAHVGIVTGFCAVVDDRVTAETDGPPGALFLAVALRSRGIAVTLITDRVALPLLCVGAELVGISLDNVLEFPHPDAYDAEINNTAATDAWIDAFLDTGRGATLTHLVSIERPGPSHTFESLAAQQRGPALPPQLAARFDAEVPPRHRDVCHNMRGQSIDRYTAPVHRLFEAIAQRGLAITTIGIGDGGNEIGMGRFVWDDVRAAVGGEVAGRIACRIATDFAIIAGVSNWGAYGLALAALRLLRGGASSPWLTAEGQAELIEALVARAGAVDGRTLRNEPTVDGLPLDENGRILAEMHALLARGVASD